MWLPAAKDMPRGYLFFCGYESNLLGILRGKIQYLSGAILRYENQQNWCINKNLLLYPVNILELLSFSSKIQ